MSLRFALVVSVVCLPFAAAAQPGGAALGDGPWFFDTSDQDAVRVSVLARDLDRPFGMVFVPGTETREYPHGDMLISERPGKLRLYRGGRLLPGAVADIAEALSIYQLFGLVLHPDFAENRLIYFPYIKTAANPSGASGFWGATAVGRGRFDGSRLSDVEDVFVSQSWTPRSAGVSSSLHFMADGTMLLGVGHRQEEEAPQSLTSHIGKILRINDDGSVPADNPFVGASGALGEIYVIGNRSIMDFATHPVTAEVWELENGPQGGDEVNILVPGRNYGWPIATFGRDYSGSRIHPEPWVEGTEVPEVFWVPSITVASMSFYTGERFPDWQGNLFVTSMIQGRVFGTGHLERVVFNEEGEIRREQMFNELGQRMRLVRQGADGLLYLLTDGPNGALLRVEPADAARVSDAAAPARPVDASILPGNLSQMAGYDCAACHGFDSAAIGPSYRDVAARYEFNEANVVMLARRIIEGSDGIWGDVPMTAHTSLSIEEANALAAGILSLGIANP